MERLIKRLLIAIAIALLILAFTATAALAHGRHFMAEMGCCEKDCAENCAQAIRDGRGSFASDRPGQTHRYSARDPAARRSNPVVLDAISGNVVDVYSTSFRQGQGTGLHLQLQADGEMLDVHLGPAWYIDQQGFAIEPGDVLKIKGMPFTKDGKPALIAVEIDRGEETLTLRDGEGFPLWRRGAPMSLERSPQHSHTLLSMTVTYAP